MTIPVNRWTISVVITALVIFSASRVRAHCDYDFGPAFAGMAALIAVGALWLGLVLATFL